ncbi:MAG: PilW family protein [Rhodoferax sp.]|nr:PilW family protein [Rhodoferax sp.]MCF8208592.1 PilW family protein [Rhodoferax sp.]
MVAMTLGLFGVLVMTQLFSLAEQNRRSTSSGNDAMNEGVLSLYALQRELRTAGYGLADVNLLGCNVLLRAGVTLVAMAPVTINHASIPAGDANTDTLLVFFSQATGSTQGDRITAAAVADQYTVQTSASFMVNDWVLAAPQVRNCAGTSAPLTPALILTQIAAITSPIVSVTAGTGDTFPAIVSPLFPTLFNFGAQPVNAVVYAVRGGNLTQCDYMVNDCGLASNASVASVWVPIGSNIVSLRAQYGRDTAAAGAMDGLVDVFDQVPPATACDWVRMSALRLVLVARSTQPAAAATALAPVWDGTASAPIDLSTHAAWQNHRYKVFQTVVALRNLAWMGQVPGC